MNMNLSRFPFALAAALAAALSAASQAAEITSTPLNAPSKGKGEFLFTELLPPDTGLDVLNKMDVDHPLSYLYHSGMTTGGVAIADFDGDGLPDVFFAGTTGKNHLYRQVGNLKFEDITDKAGPIDGGDAWTAGAAAADVNNDGRMDIYVTSYMVPNQLFMNMGKGPNGEPVVFKEVGKAAGLDAVDCSHSAAFADYDGDGKLDMYLLTNRVEDPKGTPSELPINKGPGGVTLKPGAELYYDLWRFDYDTWGTEAKGTPDRLYHNEGNGPDGTPIFKDVTKNSGVSGRGDGLSVTWWDYDMDGKVDIYVANDFITPDSLYHNNGNGTFTDMMKEAMPHVPWFSMGADFGDVNNDLLPDFFVADMSATSHFKSKTTMGIMGGTDLRRAYYGDTPQYMQNSLLINTGTGRFLEAARLFKISSTDWTWSVKFADFDNDGWQDLYFTNGISRHMNDSDKKLTQSQLTGKHMFEFFKEGEMRKEVHRAYRNSHETHFDDVSKEWGLDHLGVAYGAAYSDLDRDGDLDMIVVNLEEPNFVYRNDSQDGNRVLFKLKGTKSNINGLGATLILRTASGSQMRQLEPQTGYMSCNEDAVQFGLGKDDMIKELTVRWLGGGEQKFTDLKANQLYTITQPADGGSPVAPPAPRDTMFAESNALATSKCKDTGWDADYGKQLLLPFSLSQRGPALAWADVNGDGFDDYYFGAAAGEIPEMRINDGKGKFVAKWEDAFRKDKDCEDQGAVFLDVDGDGDLDLFVASGSNEFIKKTDENPKQGKDDPYPGDYNTKYYVNDPEAKELRDRLYLNDGKGTFTLAPAGALPAALLFSSCVCAVDYDRDGKMDVFVGTRCATGDWPHSARSRLLHNESKDKVVKFVDVTDSVPGLSNAGMVTGAIWSDANGDGWQDLLLTAEWGPLKLFTNTNGKLAETTSEAGLDAVTGWWRGGISAADVNGDGQMDYIVANMGLNTKYKPPTVDHPQLTYYYDFGATGKTKIVEVKLEDGVYYPERGKSCSGKQHPKIAGIFPLYSAFAKAKLNEVYPQEELDKAEVYKANEFQNGVFINNKGKFTFQPFERMAQLAPGNGMVACDFNGDGNQDIYISQNFYGPQIEVQRFDGGLGQLLLGDGKGGFKSVTVRDAGIEVPGDAKSASAADLNNDGKPDLIVTVNNGATKAFLNKSKAQWLRVNAAPTAAAGARITLTRDKLPTQTIELQTGSSYLAQQPAAAWFGLGEDNTPGRITVLWPDGTSTEAAFDGKPGSLQIAPTKKAVANQ